MKVDVAIVGAGLGGLSVALSLADRHRIVILAKRAANECASDYAQGGIAAVLDAADSIDAHVEDTLIAGAGLCDADAVRAIVERGRESIEWLIEQGSDFTPDVEAAFGYHLTREGGHRHRRIVHAADATGHAVLSALAARARRHPNITLLDDHLVVAMRMTDDADRTAGGRRCVGLDVLDVKAGRRFEIDAGSTVLATGGAGQVYPHTSNPETSTGDGIAMAWRAGCRVANMEFVQFHPTCLFHPDAKSFLISEAVRGEGGVLKLPNGHRFMPDHDPRAELAPRDIVARAIDTELKRHRIDCVYLDISHQPAAFLQAHFPTILARCAAFGIDITREPIPVVPAAHYTCGGIVTDTAGRTDLLDLYAVGEAAYTGLHGANRLASNSLLECVVLGRAAAKAIASRGASSTPRQPASTTSSSSSAASHDLPSSSATGSPHGAMLALPGGAALHACRHALRQAMWQHVGIVRTEQGLEAARESIAALRRQIPARDGQWDTAPTGDADRQTRDDAVVQCRRDWLELHNLLDIAALIVDSAQQRRESRGAHYRADWPSSFPKALPTIAIPPGRTSTSVALSELRGL